MDGLITANLRSRPTRTAISIFAVSMGVILMLVINGISSGTLDDAVNRTISVGADFILQSSDAGILWAFGSPSLPMGFAKKAREIEGVGVVTPVLVNPNKTDLSVTFGIDLQSYQQLPGRLQIKEGKLSLNDDEIIVDELLAKNNKLKPGMQVKVNDHMFTISGICREGSAVRKFVSLKKFQEIMGTPEKATLMFIKVAPGADPEIVGAALRKFFNGYHVYSGTDAQQMLDGLKIKILKQFTSAVIIISMLISFMVILLAMYTTIFERTREIGILKSMGASRMFVVSMVLRESVIICVLGVLLGTVASQVIRKAITAAFPILQVKISLSQIAVCCALGIIAGLLGATYPAFKAAKMDPVKALSYE